MKELSAEAARRKGRAAAKRGTDLDAAEARFLRRHGYEQIDAWLDGWTSYAVGEDA